MKILILSCSTGGGHNSAARAVREVLMQKGVETDFIDPIQLKNEKIKNTVSELYNNIIKISPKFFGAIYKIGDAYNSTRLPSPVYYANASYAKALNEYITKNNFDGVLCSHLYAMEAMTAVREKFKNTIPCYGIITDYTFIPFTSDTKLDGYFIPHAELKNEALKKGMPENGIFPYGIPVSPKFCEAISKTEAREKLSLPQEKKIVLLMFGSVGCGKITKLCKRILKELTDDCHVFLITGTNEKLKNKLKKNYAKSERLTCIGYTENVHLYMKAADVLISKAGGLSSTEAAATNVPLVHLKSLPGCETKNAEFFLAHGMSKPTKKVKEAVAFAKELLYDEKEAERMRVAQKTVINAHAAQDIGEKLIDILSNANR